LEGVLINQPFFSNKIFDLFVSDLAEIKGKLTENEDLERYLTPRYLNKIKEIDLKKLFRSLWKVTFVTDDQISQENVSINFKALRIIFRKYRSACYEAIKAERVYYSNIKKDSAIHQLIILMADFPNIYSDLDTSLQLIIQNRIKTNQEAKLIGWFIERDFAEYIKKLDPTEFDALSFFPLRFFIRISSDNGYKKLGVKFLIEYFGSSKTFDTSKKRFDKVILPLIKEFDDNDFEDLLSEANKNDQIYYRWGLADAFKEKVLERFGEKYDFTKYPNLFRQFIRQEVEKEELKADALNEEVNETNNEESLDF